MEASRRGAPSRCQRDAGQRMLNHADRLVRSVGRRVAELRRARGLTQARFADELGVSLPYVQRIEGGLQNLTLRSLAELADALQADVVDLFVPPAQLRAQRGRPRKG